MIGRVRRQARQKSFTKADLNLAPIRGHTVQSARALALLASPRRVESEWPGEIARNEQLEVTAVVSDGDADPQRVATHVDVGSGDGSVGNVNYGSLDAVGGSEAKDDLLSGRDDDEGLRGEPAVCLGLLLESGLSY